MKKYKSNADDQRDALANEVAERHDIILKLKVDLSSLEERHRTAVTQVDLRAPSCQCLCVLKYIYKLFLFIQLAEKDGVIKQIKAECKEQTSEVG